MRIRTTSTQRTYRYVRLSLVGAMLFLGTGVGLQAATGGPLPSVSAAYYTAAQGVFVGSLCAIALALLVLSGRSLEQMLLDLAALFAPVVALVPSPVQTGVVSGVVVSCPGDGSCVPTDAVPAVAVSMPALLVVGGVGVAATATLAVVQGIVDRGVVVSLIAAAGIVTAWSGWWFLSPDTFLKGAHNVAAIAFFALVGAVALIAALRPAARTTRRHLRLRIAYGIVVVGIVVALGLLIVVVVARVAGVTALDELPIPLFFLGEATALVLFAVFWLVQTVELWNEADADAFVSRRALLRGSSSTRSSSPGSS